MTANPLLELIGRDQSLFDEDLAAHEHELTERIAASRLLVIGGAGSIGAAVVKELFQRSPKLLHVVDASENNLTELVRDIRSSLGYIEGEFRTFCLDLASPIFDAFVQDQAGYDMVLNFAALKHVRSEKDPYTLMRMIEVNLLGTVRTLRATEASGASRFFCVSTDKASDPVNMMGASKRIMEMLLARESERLPVSSARFANVIFSYGSLPDGWTYRLAKRQPIVAPDDVKRYFITDVEGARLCLLSAFFGENRDIFFPRLDEKLDLIRFSEIARRHLRSLGYEPVGCETEAEARSRVEELLPQKRWPCYFFASDTTGEKDFEAFYTAAEAVNWDRFRDVGVVRNDLARAADRLDAFCREIEAMRDRGHWTKPELVALFNRTLGTFAHQETGKYLDNRM
jgi:FlaA1/EpsC-like NDP-sugar epimerase